MSVRGTALWRALVLAVIAAIAGGFWYRYASSRTASSYNLLLISLDTVRQDVVGAYGHRPRHAPDLSTTPALDQLARDGVRMVDAYASSAWTLPSHLSLLTGQTPLVHGVETEGGSLDPSIPTMAEILARHGYRTFGFYSAPYVAPHWGFGRGFERYEAVYPAVVAAGAQRAAAMRAEVERAAAAGDWPRYDQLKREETAIDHELNARSEEAVTSDQVSKAVIAQLRELAGGAAPWFVFAHFFDAHCDYVPPPPFDTRFDPDYRGNASGIGCLAGDWVASPDPARPGGLIRNISNRDLEHVFALYEGEVAWVDANVAAILGALDELHLTDRTLVIVVSDHGEEFFEHGGLGHRHNLYEEVARVPMLLRLPRVLPRGAAIRGPVSLSDVLPTALDLLGLPAEVGPGSGESFVGLIRGGADAERRSVLARVVMMFGGSVQVDGTQDVLFRQVMVQDVFRQGPLKIMRTRSWPQFAADAEPLLRQALASEAGAQYQREDLRWIDLSRSPGEAENRYSADFSDAAAAAGLDAFRNRYRGLLASRKRAAASPLPQNVRDALEQLGYGETASGAQFPEPDVMLPPPAAH